MRHGFHDKISAAYVLGTSRHEVRCAHRAPEPEVVRVEVRRHAVVVMRADLRRISRERKGRGRTAKTKRTHSRVNPGTLPRPNDLSGLTSNARISSAGGRARIFQSEQPTLWCDHLFRRDGHSNVTKGVFFVGRGGMLCRGGEGGVEKEGQEAEIRNLVPTTCRVNAKYINTTCVLNTHAHMPVQSTHVSIHAYIHTNIYAFECEAVS